ncbi:ATP-binding cassette domain-containing protein [Dactylosporangium sp. CA-139114]|uniref:ATP-binding cassette domain-containing protein n=1 Tax=Dactylosporangium sp. CA-139114 TaxID=3239931 RepID=UPI003D9829E7
MIEVDSLRKRFGRVQALAGVDLAVERGSVLGLLGHNGAGKTTLVRILATLVRPGAGRAAVGGFDVATQPVAVRRLIGLAGQHAAVDETLTGRENLEIVGRLYRLRRRDARRRAVDVLDQLGLTDAADRPARTYSGGMRRRLDLGASLVGQPAVLLLDEPTTGLDPAARLDLWARIRALAAQGTTVLLTTQQLDEADYLADTVVVFDHGTVVASGTTEQLKARLGDERIMLTLAGRGSIDDAVRRLAPIATASPRVDPDTARITIAVRGGSAGLAAAVRLLDEGHIALADVAVHRPTLQDVYLALTGHDTPSAAAAAATEGSTA